MALEPGEIVPDFELRDQHGQGVRLSAFRGQRAVVVMFYPFAFSGVCTSELGEVQKNVGTTAFADAVVIAISCDPMFALRTFADRDGLDFPLLSDFWPHGAISRAFGVFDEERGCPTRSTFILDHDAIVRWSVHNAFSDARDIDEYARVLVGLKAEK